MSTFSVVMETLGMMAFTFGIGMAVAALMKALVFLYAYFSPENITLVVHNYKRQVAREKRLHKQAKVLCEAMEKKSTLPFLQYKYENKDTHSNDESIDDAYDLFNFYRGIYKDKDDNEGLDGLFKYYHGEI